MIDYVVKGFDADLYGTFGEFWDIVALQQECIVVWVALWQQERLVVAAFTVKIGDEDARIVVVIPAAREDYPATVGGPGVVAVCCARSTGLGKRTLTLVR